MKAFHEARVYDLLNFNPVCHCRNFMKATVSRSERLGLSSTVRLEAQHSAKAYVHGAQRRQNSHGLVLATEAGT